MSNLENKEEKVVNKIVSVVNKLDKELDELDTLSENPEKKHNLKKWLVERKAIHEIKKVLHEADKYLLSPYSIRRGCGYTVSFWEIPQYRSIFQNFVRLQTTL
ncbi:hypothetical protein EfmGK923_08970 [Enterococcus faecium]|uniref:hypothetical protein n=4 Tax=Enterococcus faecium TaxID=1352 RepID=UPI002207B642|nr:hypothetical protein [Enterococcus faecium]BDP90724.1 hypothetical protein EfmGK923_08970 [Enterococcus faecium]